MADEPIGMLEHAKLQSEIGESKYVIGPAERSEEGRGTCFCVALPVTLEGDDTFSSDMLEYCRRYQAPCSINVLVTVPDTFPLVPPEMRLLWPTLRHGTSNVLNGCVLLPFLLPEGWDPQLSLGAALAMLIPALRQAKPPARIHLDTPTIYNKPAFDAARSRLLRRVEPARWHDPKARFAGKYRVFSAHFAQLVMALDLPHGFEEGNKALMPSAMLELIYRDELEGAGRNYNAGSVAELLGSPESANDQSAMVFGMDVC
jgi:hypothetical protein